MVATANAADVTKASSSFDIIVLPVDAKTTSKTIGITTRLPSCWAARMSLTLDDIIMLASTLKTHTSGAIRPIIIAQYVFGIRKVPNVKEDQPSMRAENTVTPM
jgi:hypothetical protein